MSPRILPFVCSLLGSIVSTASFLPSPVKCNPKVSIKVLFPAPGTPVIPILIDFAQEASGILQHLHPQGPVRQRDAARRGEQHAELRQPGRHREGRQRLAAVQLRHLSLVPAAELLVLAITAGHPERAGLDGTDHADRPGWPHRPEHPVEHPVRPDRRRQVRRRGGADIDLPVQPAPAAQRIRRTRHHDGLDGDHLPHRVRPPDRPAAVLHGVGSHRVRLGLAVVRRPAMADRGAVAVPDPGADPGKVALPRAHREGQAEHPRPEQRAALRPARAAGGAHRGARQRLQDGQPAEIRLVDATGQRHRHGAAGRRLPDPDHEGQPDPRRQLRQGQGGPGCLRHQRSHHPARLDPDDLTAWPSCGRRGSRLAAACCR